MKILLATTTLFLITEVARASVIDPNVNLTEDEFAAKFNHTKVTDPEELRRRQEALAAAEAEVEKVNEAFLAGNATWFDAINEFSDLPADEMRNHTGRVTYATGRLEPSPEERYDEESEKYFDQFRYSRAVVPDSYNAVAQGLVTPVRSQGSCGSCVAFATAVTVETCFKKVTGVFGDYSEQQMVDCAYQYKGAGACKGAATHSYTDWLADKKIKLASEAQYPYKEAKGTCPANPPVFNQGAAVTGSYKTYEATEELMKKMVYEHGAVVGSVVATGPFKQYSKGIFAGCTDHSSESLDHCIAVVGYGSEGGVDYWLIKNSWGTSWGENGYIRLKRGVGMCGIGIEIATVTCAKDGEATATTAAATTTTTAPVTTTKKACEDKFEYCASIAELNEYDYGTPFDYCEYFATECPKSCKKC